MNIVAAFAAVAFLLCAAVASAQPFAYVSNEKSGAVSIIDPVGELPWGVVIR